MLHSDDCSKYGRSDSIGPHERSLNSIGSLNDDAQRRKATGQPEELSRRFFHHTILVRGFDVSYTRVECLKIGPECACGFVCECGCRRGFGTTSHHVISNYRTSGQTPVLGSSEHVVLNGTQCYHTAMGRLHWRWIHRLPRSAKTPANFRDTENVEGALMRRNGEGGFSQKKPEEAMGFLCAK